MGVDTEATSSAPSIDVSATAEYRSFTNSAEASVVLAAEEELREDQERTGDLGFEDAPRTVTGPPISAEEAERAMCGGASLLLEGDSNNDHVSVVQARNLWPVTRRVIPSVLRLACNSSP